MCGIVGVVGNIFKKEEEIFEDLLRIDVIRGPHSTGVAVMRGSTQVAWVKDTALPEDLIDSKAYRSMFWGKVTAVIGHNRWATRGKVSSQNAHPFSIGDITGVHNGTLTNQTHLPDHRKFVVDSENIIHSINKEGIDDTAGNLQGAYCLVWMNSTENTINFLRNKERPLFMTVAEDGNTLFYASEGWMLSGVLGRHGKKHGEITPLPVDTLLTYHLGNAKVPLDKPHCRKLEGRPPPPPVKQLPSRQALGHRDIWANVRGNSKVVADLPPTVGGVQWKKGDVVEFRVTSMKRVDSGRPMGKIIGTTIAAGGQRVICYVKENHYLYKKIQKSIGDVFVGHLSSLWFDERSVLNILIDPETLSAHHTDLVPSVDDVPFGEYTGGRSGNNKEEEIPIVDRDGNTIGEGEFNKLTKNGCSWCASPADHRKSADLIWLDTDEFICHECGEDHQVKEYLKGSSQFYNC